MASTENAMLAAIHQRLSGDAALSALLGGAAIHDRRLTRPAAPYLLVGPLEVRDYAADGDAAGEAGAACEIFFSLEAWSAEGRRQAGEIAERARFLLHRADLPLESRTLIDLQCRATASRREPKTPLFCGELRFRAVVE